MTRAVATISAGKRAIALPYRPVSISPDLELIIGPAGCKLLSAAQARALRTFSRLRSEGGADDGVIAEGIAFLKRTGLLVDEEKIMGRFRRTTGASAAPRIGSFGIPTCNRPLNLANCARSLVENARAHGRRVEIVVVDVSPSGAVRGENLAQLRAFSEMADIRYCGPEQRIAFWKQLGTRGVAGDVGDITFRSFAAESNFGAARNALMLDQAGEAFISADDDIIARTAIHPTVKEGIRIAGGERCFDCWFFPDRPAALEWARWEQADIVGEHAALLGRSVATLLASGAQPVNLDGMCGHFADPEWAPRIVGTMPGKVGDSGRGDPAWDVWAGNWVPDRGLLGRLEVAELAESTVIGHHIGFMATMVALDLRRILPPFFPRHRGEDRMFAALLSRAMPEACWGIVPHGIIHDRPPRGIEDPPPFLRHCEMICAQLWGLPARRSGRSDADAIREAGADLSRSIDAGTRELQLSTLEHLGNYVAGWIAQFRRMCESDLATDQRAQIEETRQRIQLEFAELCDAVSKPATTGFSWEGLGRELAEYGQLLQHWPEIYETARKLRAECIRMSVPLGDCR